ncbi:MAG: hypothetical protein II643_06125, partial [Oscillospiraceae bacterium]|nr:hypothetical protein [Oscillospiraceae bacterium]
DKTDSPFAGLPVFAVCDKKRQDVHGIIYTSIKYYAALLTYRLNRDNIRCKIEARAPSVPPSI